LVEKLHDVVGVYLNPPDNAVVFSFDEKSQIQALDRTQPGLPLKRGRAGTMTHDYKRHGTTTLFAALEVATGEVIHECMPRHRHQEFLKFLKRIEKSVELGLEIHVVLDNSRVAGLITRSWRREDLAGRTVRMGYSWQHLQSYDENGSGEGPPKGS
jgi:transposase